MANGEVSVLLFLSKMEIVLKKFDDSHIDGMVKIWNDVVIDGIAFPQEETLTVEDVKDFQKDLKKQEKSKVSVKSNQKNSKKDNV